MKTYFLHKFVHISETELTLHALSAETFKITFQKMTDNGGSEVVAKMAQKAFASSSNYENVRANYSLEAVEFFLRKLGVNWDNHDKATENQTDHPLTVLEVGCGTGKFTRVMLEVLKGKNVRVIASEPLQSMCEQLKLMVPDTEIIQCPAENT